MGIQTRTLPDYKNPPVNEVVLGVQFDSLEKFNILHPGLFWEKIRDEYPVFSAQPPLAQANELFGEKILARDSTITSTLLDVPPLPRCWFLDQPENRLIQLQPDRFIHNWKQVTGTEKYPHYDNIFPEFQKRWENFCDFVSDEGIGQVKINHWEVTYVNLIFQGQGWNDLGDLYKLFPILSNNVLKNYLRSPEKITLNLAYSFPDKLTRLHIDLKTAYRRTDNAPLFRFAFTARGKLDSDKKENLYECLNFGHEKIVLSFTDLTSPEAHKLWKREV